MYDPGFIEERAEQLPLNATCYELLLWPWLELHGFFCQYPVEVPNLFFLDFYHPETGLNVELDGKSTHSAERDAYRDSLLTANGITVLRFPNQRVWFELNDVVYEILDAYDQLYAASRAA